MRVLRLDRRGKSLFLTDPMKTEDGYTLSSDKSLCSLTGQRIVLDLVETESPDRLARFRHRIAENIYEQIELGCTRLSFGFWEQMSFQFVSHFLDFGIGPAVVACENVDAIFANQVAE